MITVKEFEDTYVEGSDVNLPGSTSVWYGEAINGRYVTETRVYKVEDQFFAVITIHESSSEYWGDSEVLSVDVTEVRPYIFTETRYK